MTIRNKVLLSLAVISVFLTTLVVYSLFSLNRMNNLADQVVPITTEIVHLQHVSDSLGKIEGAVEKYLALGYKEYQDQYNEGLENVIVHADEIRAEADTDLAGHMGIIISSVENLQQTLKIFEGDEASTIDPDIVNRSLVEIYSAISDLKQATNEMLVGNIEILKTNVEEQKEVLSSFILRFLILMCIVLIVLTVISILFIQSLLNPIVALHSGVTQISEGDLSTYLDVRSNDEVGQLAKAFNDMTGRLRESRKNLEGKVSERTKELESTKDNLQNKVEELEKFQRLTVGRELRMIELKKEIKALKEKATKGEET